MSVKIKTKQKVKPQSAQSEKSFDLSKAATRYKKVEAEINEIMKDPALKKKMDEMELLKKQMIEYANDTLADEEGTEVKTKYGDVKIGKRGTARSVTDMDKAVEMLGTDTFMKIAKIGLADLDKYLNPDQLELVTVTKVTNTRRIS